MATKHRKKRGQGWLAFFVPLALLNLGLVIFNLTYGKNIAILNPAGLIAKDQFNLFVFTALVLMAVTIPVIGTLYFVAWKYRETNHKPVYDPNASQGKGLPVFMWGFPVIFLIILSLVMIPATHRLEPRKVIASNGEPMKIQVVALQWKWLFIYPEQQIATVNYLQIPVDRPVTFELTADETPMSSFWIPNLGGQLYAMTGHVNRLNLVADEVGDYPGSTAEINGPGFATMRFTTRATTIEDFDSWVNSVKDSENVLSKASYDALVKPSEKNTPAFYASYPENLVSGIVQKYAGSHETHGSEKNASEMRHGGEH